MLSVLFGSGVLIKTFSPERVKLRALLSSVVRFQILPDETPTKLEGRGAP